MYLPIKWGVKEPQRILKITQELTCRPWKVRGPQLGKDRLPVPVYYTLDLPPKTQDAILTTRMTSGWLGMAPRSDKLSLATSQHPGGLYPNSIPAPKNHQISSFCFLTGRSIHPKRTLPPTHTRESQTIKLLLNLEGRLSILIPFSADSLRVETEALALVLVLHQAGYLWKFLSGTERLLLPAVGRLGHFSLRIQTFC